MEHMDREYRTSTVFQDQSLYFHPSLAISHLPQTQSWILFQAANSARGAGWGPLSRGQCGEAEAESPRWDLTRVICGCSGAGLRESPAGNKLTAGTRAPRELWPKLLRLHQMERYSDLNPHLDTNPN